MRLTQALLITAAAFLTATPALATDVKIGVLNDRSGIYADLSGEGSVIAAKMAIEDYRAAAKGINVTVISADHQNKPDIASNIARQWYDQDGVDAIFDVPTSSAALAVSEVTREKNKVFINSGAGSTDLTGKACSPNTIHWTYDTYALANGTAKALAAQDKKSWFFITADYAFGQALERDASEIVKAAGGNVAGAVRHPFPGSDFSSFLLQAQGSGAQVIGLANAGGDTVNAIKQAKEFGITQGGQTLAALLMFVTDVHALGLETAQGLTLTEAFY
jgi:branched-chain amino acid transport system substrate-binding protein